MTDKEFSNLPVGNSFIMGNKVLKVVESSQCIDCFLRSIHAINYLVIK